MHFVKRIAHSSLGSGLPYKVLRTYALRDKPVTILCYHTLRPDHDNIDAWTVLRVSDFRRQVAFLRSHYDIVSLDQALENSSDKQKPLVVLTFDDGDIGLFYHLLPLVQSERLPVTVYISTGQIESGQPYWFDRIMNALQRPEKTIIDLTDHGLRSWLVGPETGVSRWAIISDILETLKSISPSGRKVLVEKIIEQAGSAISGFTPIAPMSIKQLKSLAEDPLVTIGAHSHCHNLLNQIPLDQARASIQMSRTLLETWTDQEIRHFAYPNGSHTTELQAELAQQGFISATVLDAELATLSMNRFALSRVGVGRYDTLNRFKLKLVKI